MTDGQFDGLPAADEVVAVVAGMDHGWPRCVGDNRAVVEFGGSDDDCPALPASQALFAPSATPTSIIEPPVEPGTLWIALWNEGRVVAVSSDPALRPAPLVDILTGVARPQHLVAHDGSVFLTDFRSGRILRIDQS